MMALTGKHPVERIGWIDTAKGFGIFLVVFGHALPNDLALQSSLMAASIVWTFHMPLFFFLSGLTARPWAPHAYGPLAKGLKNLVVPYGFFSLVGITLWLAAHGKLGALTWWKRLAGEMAYGVSGVDTWMRYDPPLWFFTCLFATRVLFLLLTALAPSRRATMIAAILLAGFAHLVVFAYFKTLVWNLDVALVALLFYTAAYVLRPRLLQDSAATKVTSPTRRCAGVAVALAVVLAIALVNGRTDMNYRHFGNPLYFYIGAFAGIYLVIAVARMIHWHAWIGSLGHASIVIFPVHNLWLLLPYRAMPALQWYGFRMTHSDVCAAILTAMVEIALCMPLYFVLKRWAPGLIGQARPRNAAGTSTPDSTKKDNALQ